MFLNTSVRIEADQIKASRLSNDPGFVWLTFNATCSIALDATELQALLAEGQREYNAMVLEARAAQAAA